jgi:hypothetical protein
MIKKHSCIPQLFGGVEIKIKYSIFINNQQIHFMTVYYFTSLLLHVSMHVYHHQQAFLCLLSYTQCNQSYN